MRSYSPENYTAKILITKIIDEPDMIQNYSDLEKLLNIIVNGFFNGEVSVDDLEGLRSDEAKQNPTVQRLCDALVQARILAPSTMRGSPADELSEDIYGGRISQILDANIVLGSPEAWQSIRTFFQREPFNRDELLRRNLDVINQHLNDGANDRETIKAITERLEFLKKYVNVLAVTMNYMTLDEFDASRPQHMNMVEVASSQTVLKYLEPHAKAQGKIDHAIDKLSTDGIDSFLNVRGDGSCYYRVILRRYIEHAIMYPGDRAKMFNHLAEMYERELLKVGSCFRQDFEEGSDEHQRLVTLIAKLRDAEAGRAWTSIQAFDKDLDDPSVLGDDYALILATRYLTAQCVVDHREMRMGEVFSLKDLIEASPGGDDIDVYRKQNITSMGGTHAQNPASGTDAEGTWVEAGLLPLMLGLESHTYHIARRTTGESMVTAIGQPLFDKEGFAARYRTQGLPRLSVNPMLIDGHYRLGLSRGELIERNEAKHRAPSQIFDERRLEKVAEAKALGASSSESKARAFDEIPPKTVRKSGTFDASSSESKARAFDEIPSKMVGKPGSLGSSSSRATSVSWGQDQRPKSVKPSQETFTLKTLLATPGPTSLEDWLAAILLSASRGNTGALNKNKEAIVAKLIDFMLGGEAQKSQVSDFFNTHSEPNLLIIFESLNNTLLEMDLPEVRLELSPVVSEAASSDTLEEGYDLDNISLSDNNLEHWLDAILIAATEPDAPKLSRHEREVIEKLTEFMMNDDANKPIIQRFFVEHGSNYTSLRPLLKDLNKHLRDLGVGFQIKEKSDDSTTGFRAKINALKVREGKNHSSPVPGGGSFSGRK